MSLIMCFNRGAGTGSPGKYLIIIAKGQLISKADWRAIDSTKKRTNEFVLFAVKSKQNKVGCLFLGRIYQSAFGFI